MKLLISSFFLLLLSCTLSAQDLNIKSGAPSAATSTATMLDPRPFGNTITAEEIKTLITMLASDSFQGRETGEPGQRLAATYIAAQMKAAGLPAVPVAVRSKTSAPVVKSTPNKPLLPTMRAA